MPFYEVDLAYLLVVRSDGCLTHQGAQDIIEKYGGIKIIWVVDSDCVLHIHVLPNITFFVGVLVEVEYVNRLSRVGLAKGASLTIGTEDSISVKFSSAFAAFPLVG